MISPGAHEALFQLRHSFTSNPGTGVICIHRGKLLKQSAVAYVDLPELTSVICWRRAASVTGMVFDLFSQRDITNLIVRTLRCKNCIRRPDYGWLYRNGIDASRATGVRRAWRSNGNVVLISSLRHSTCVRPDCARHLSIVSIVWYRVSIRPMDVEPWAVWMKSLWSRHIPSAFRKRRL